LKFKGEKLGALISLDFEEYVAVALGKSILILKNLQGDIKSKFNIHERDVEQMSHQGEKLASASLKEIIILNWMTSIKYRKILIDMKSIRSLVFVEDITKKLVRLLIGGSEVKEFKFSSDLISLPHERSSEKRRPARSVNNDLIPVLNENDYKVKTFNTATKGWCLSLKKHENDDYFITCHTGKSIHVWSLSDGDLNPKNSISFEEAKGPLVNMVFVDQNTVALGGKNPEIIFIDIVNKKIKKYIPKCGEGMVLSMTITKDKRYLIYNCKNEELTSQYLTVLDLDSNQNVENICLPNMEEENHQQTDIIFSINVGAKYLVAASSDCSLYCWKKTYV
jgi:WD40 repeat protein